MGPQIEFFYWFHAYSYTKVIKKLKLGPISLDNIFCDASECRHNIITSIGDKVYTEWMGREHNLRHVFHCVVKNVGAVCFLYFHSNTTLEHCKIF